MKGDFVDGKVDAEIGELEQVHPYDRVRILGELGVVRQTTKENCNVGGMEKTKLKFGECGRFPLQLPVEVEALCRVVVEVELVGDFLVYDGDGSAGVEDELQVVSRADSPLDLDEITFRKSEG
jgi:hypothetical protein